MVTENLSPVFFGKIKKLLGDEYEDYVRSLSAPRERGLRVNAYKTTAGELAEKLDLRKPVPFEKNGFFIGERKFGSHPYHHAGLFYLQEPSAMLPVAAIAPYLKGNILDLCAAPGGKSTQIIDSMRKGSFLISNEIVPSRAGVLASNLERMGATSAVTCMKPQDMEKICPSFFDAIIVDAPCSGEGMFRKEEAAIRDWSEANVNSCAARQYEILLSAADMLKAGGYMVYSTCTLNTVENEGVIIKFLEKRKDFTAVEPNDTVRKNTRRGFGLNEAMRLFPHSFAGEGHFACLLKKREGETDTAYRTFTPFSPLKAEKTQVYDFLSELGINTSSVRTEKYADTVYIVSENFSVPQGLRIFRGGLPVMKILDKRVEPLHGAATFLKRGECIKTVNFPCDSQEISDYLKGETLSVSTPFTGYGIITADGYPLGLIKSVNGTLKNHYPKGLWL